MTKDVAHALMRAASRLVSTLLLAIPLQAQPTAPKFEVASIKPCNGAADPDAKSGGGKKLSPGTLHLDCTTALDLIKHAYVLFANGHVNPRSLVQVEGGPAWTRAERYQIEARSDDELSQGMMHGPMLQALLADRFALKIHRETRPVAAYALTVAKGGLKLRRFQQGTCVPVDLRIFEQFPPPPFPELPPGQAYCGGKDPDGSRWVAASTSQKGPNFTVEAKALSIDEFVKHALAQNLDRPVVNRTVIQGLFDFHLEFSADDAPPGPAEIAGVSIFTALQRQLGLKLEPAKAPGEFLVIDRVEKPSGN